MSINDLVQDGNIGDKYKLSLAEGIASGLISNTFSEVISGYIGTSSTNTVTVRATAYTPQGNNIGRSISSTSSSDTVAGVGARTVLITYLDASCNGPFTETLSLDGVTPVNTIATNIALIERIEVMGVGSNGGNVGTIRIHTFADGGGSIWGSIGAGDNRTYWAHHYVPINRTLLLESVAASASITTGAVTVNYLNPLDTSAVQHNPGGTLRYGLATVNMNLSVPIRVDGPAIIFLNSRPDTATVSTSFAFFGYIQF